MTIIAVACPGKYFCGFNIMTDLVGGPGTKASAGRRRIFENTQRNSARKLWKYIIFAYSSKKFQNPALDFRGCGRKTLLAGEILRKHRKLLMKIQ